MLMSRPRAGEIDSINVYIRESAEFKVSVTINEQKILGPRTIVANAVITMLHHCNNKLPQGIECPFVI